jgi:hypothetical protein
MKLIAAFTAAALMIAPAVGHAQGGGGGGGGGAGGAGGASGAGGPGMGLVADKLISARRPIV